MPLSNGLDSRLRGNDGIGLPLQHGFFRFYVLDSRLRGNDESIHTETCTTSFPRTYIPSFPQKQKPQIPSFPRRRESRLVGADAYRIKRFLEIPRPGFPLSRE
ncbi:hypothetical protein E4O71_11920 [Neisseria meningitidis]|nr:hypothetical protein [Neisseria meningitidis]